MISNQPERQEISKVVSTASQTSSLDPFWVQEYLGDAWCFTQVNHSKQGLSSSELLRACGDANVLIVGDDFASRNFFESLDGKLKLIVKWGVGIDSIDLEAARVSGVTVRNTPGLFGDEVADLAIGMMLDLVRNITRTDDLVRSGKWPKVPGVSLRGKTAGILGFGNVGRQIAIRAHSFGLNILFHDPLIPDPLPIEAKPVSLKNLFRDSQMLFIAAPSSESTLGIVNAHSLSLMPEKSWVINVSRGNLVDESALADALNTGHLAGAALDVYENEPLPIGSPLRSFDNVLFGAHNASNTMEAVERASIRALEIVKEWDCERAS